MLTMGQRVRLDNGRIAIFKRMDGDMARVMVLINTRSVYDLLIEPRRIVEAVERPMFAKDHYLEEIIKGEIQ